MRNIFFFIRTKTARSVALLAAMLCIAIAGCSQDVLAPIPEPSPTVEEGADATPKTGGTLTLPMPEGASLGNPLAVTTREMSSIYGLIFESLLETDDSGMPGPYLAETWAGSEDGRIWTFTLRSGVKWHGTDRPLDAGDLVFTLDQIKELGKSKRWGYVMDYLKSWKANDDGTFEIELKKPFYGALHALTFPVLPADGGYDNGNAPDVASGTGPYRVISAAEGGPISLTSNAQWWKKQPYITTINVIAFPDNDTAISTLVLGSSIDAVQTGDLTVTQHRESGDANLYEYPTRYFEYVAFNFDSPDLQDKLIRQAIAFAIDRLEIVSYTYVNHAIVTDTPVPPDSWLYDGKLLKYNFDTDEARRLIMLAGWTDADSDGYWDTSPDGIKRELTFSILANRDENNTIRSDAAVLMAAHLDKAGIKVELKTAAWAEYTKMLNEKRFDMALCGCYQSPVPDYRFLLSSTGELNIGKYHSEHMDTLLESILEDSKDSSTLKVKTGDLQSTVIEELPILCLYFRTHSLLTSTGLISVTGSVSGAREDNAYARINQWYMAD